MAHSAQHNIWANSMHGRSSYLSKNLEKNFQQKLTIKSFIFHILVLKMTVAYIIHRKWKRNRVLQKKNVESIWRLSN